MQRRAWNVFINIFPCFTNVTNLHVYCDGSSSTVDALSCSSFIGAILSAVRVERSMKKLGVTRNVVWFPNPLTSKSDWDPVYTERGCRILSQFVHRKCIKQGHSRRAERESRRNDCDKKFKANLARRGQLFERGIFSQFQRTPRLLFRKLKKNKTFLVIACIVYLGAQSYRLFLFWSNILTCLFHHHHSGVIKILTVLRKKTKDVGATVGIMFFD